MRHIPTALDSFLRPVTNGQACTSKIGCKCSKTPLGRDLRNIKRCNSPSRQSQPLLSVTESWIRHVDTLQSF